MIIIGEKINGSIPSMGKAIAAKDEDHIRNMAKAQSEVGSDVIDVCASVEVSKELETLKWMLDIVQEVTDTPLAVDSPSADICAEAMDFCKKPGLINSVSMEGNKVEAHYRPDCKGEYQKAGEGRLPPPNKDQISIQCYHGPPNAEHWIRFDDFRVTQKEK